MSDYDEAVELLRELVNSNGLRWIKDRKRAEKIVADADEQRAAAGKGK